ncbi:MAG: NAD(P)-dependent oxidoreductase [Ruminococcus sp.]|nr:NAD(P)-dependent oxidoreductase [Ruminococcus sp.]
MRIAVTGATSFIGSAFIKAAAAKGHSIVAVVRRNSSKADELRAMENVTVTELDMEEYDRLGEAAGETDCFVHFAWNGTRGLQRADESLQRASYENSMAAVRSVIAAGCHKVVTAGSQAEYGNVRDMITEDTECCPNTMYGTYKLRFFREAQELCRENGIPLVEPRFFSLYGPGDFEGTLIMSMIRKMKNNEPCDLTECIQMWDFLYVSDAVGAVLRLCEKETAEGVYNLGSGDVRQLKDYVEELYTITGSSSELNYGAVPYPPTGMVSIYPSVEKTKAEAGEYAVTSFRDGIMSMI